MGHLGKLFLNPVVNLFTVKESLLINTALRQTGLLIMEKYGSQATTVLNTVSLDI